MAILWLPCHRSSLGEYGKVAYTNLLRIDRITAVKQPQTKSCAYFIEYSVPIVNSCCSEVVFTVGRVVSIPRAWGLSRDKSIYWHMVSWSMQKLYTNLWIVLLPDFHRNGAGLWSILKLYTIAPKKLSKQTGDTLKNSNLSIHLYWYIIFPCNLSIT